MNESTYLKVGEKCERCGTERVEITHATLQKMQELRPNIRSIPYSIVNEGRDLYAICPSCDAYALGADLVQPFPFKDKFGSIKTIREY
ncbi:hypothetical protein [Crenothrix sp.]|uniref:hypothetical protein n=1 Tax=Crenothrix sp. TaxID=3100433 RepID=UPI00374D41BD